MMTGLNFDMDWLDSLVDKYFCCKKLWNHARFPSDGCLKWTWTLDLCCNTKMQKSKSTFWFGSVSPSLVILVFFYFLEFLHVINGRTHNCNWMIDNGIKAFLSPMSLLLLAFLMPALFFWHRCFFIDSYKMASVYHILTCYHHLFVYGDWSIYGFKCIFLPS